MSNIVENKRNLTYFSVEDISKAEPVTNSWLIAEAIGCPHFQVTRLIKKHLESLNVFGRVDFQSHPFETRGGVQDVEIAILNKGQFLHLVTLFRARKEYPKILMLKIEMVRRFLSMEKAITQAISNRKNTAWQEARGKGIAVRKDETDVIRQFVEYATAQGSKHAQLYYMHITSATYKALFFLEQKYPQLRNLLDWRQLTSLIMAENVVRCSLVKCMAAKMFYKNAFEVVKKDLELYVAITGGKSSVPLAIKPELNCNCSCRQQRRLHADFQEAANE